MERRARLPESPREKSTPIIGGPFPRAPAAANLGARAVSPETGAGVNTERSIGAVPDDADLVGRTLTGERAAFDRLVERYQRRATSVAYRLLGNLHDALEVCQDAFVRAFRSLDTLEAPERFGSWLLRIVTNLSLNARRGRAKGPRKVSFDDCVLDDGQPAEQFSANPASADSRPGGRLAEEELSAAVHAALTELPEQQRAILVLFGIEQIPQREVAEIMSCSVEAVKWHVFQARKKLKERLAEYL